MERALPYVLPRLTGSMAALEALAFNLRWTWEPETLEVFRQLDPQLWELIVDNPVLMLLMSPPKKLASAARVPSLRAEVTRAANDLQKYLEADGWFPQTHPDLSDLKIAYFTMEVGLTECLPFYAGGLGILAGDHLKACSALDVPVVGVSLLWQGGYFRQMLDANGWQLERHPSNIFAQMPIQVQRQEDGAPLTVKAALPGRDVEILVWRAEVGRTSVLLLDTNLPTNSAADRGITSDLYGGGREMRLQQEIVLGIGGIRALAAIGIRPEVCHLNESHAAFVVLERIRGLIRETGLTFDAARCALSAGNVFTTHTPVPAGFDTFAPELMERYFTEYAPELGISLDTLMGLGRTNPWNRSEPFGMAGLALRGGSSCNGVSQLHGEVSKGLFGPEFPHFPLREIPISAVTNGIHTHSWVSVEMVDLLHRHLGETILEAPDAAAWEGILQVPDGDLWGAHCRGRESLVTFARLRLRQQLAQRGVSREEVAVADEVLDPHVLTVGFARRFAAYKRPTLFLRDRERIKRILLNPDRPVQMVIAGKAHPADEGGKAMIQEIVSFTHEPGIRSRIVFLEDYDMSLAARLTQGVDVWLNNPRRPLEASGTSGMKALPNGGLNFSVLDGWWAEAFSPEVGWAIGNEDEHEDVVAGDALDAESLYAQLEGDIVPLFYDRDAAGLPHGWVAKMKASMSRLCYRFNTNRMVHEYTEAYYVPAARRAGALAEDGFRRARDLSEWDRRVRRAWDGVRIEGVDRTSSDKGVHYEVTTALNGLMPDEVVVEVFSEPIPSGDDAPTIFRLSFEAPPSVAASGVRFTGSVPDQGRPLTDYTIRILPFHPDAALPINLPLIRWER